MNARRLAAALFAALFALALPASSALGAPTPVWRLSDTALPSNFSPGDEGNSFGPLYLLVATNVGAKATAGTVTLTDALPVGIEPVSVAGNDNGFGKSPAVCPPPLGQTITCTSTSPIFPGHHLEVVVQVNVAESAVGALSDEARVEGGEASPATASAPTSVGSPPPPFDFLPGFGAPFEEEDGATALLAGAHPYQLGIEMGFPTEKPVPEALAGTGHLRSSFVEFPRGETIDPTATPVLCTEVQLISEEFEEAGEHGCPPASQVGTVTIVTVGLTREAASSPLYNMVPPPGAPASLGFDALNVGVFPHLTGALRSDGDYGITGEATELDALAVHPVFGVRVELWGDPTSAVHDGARGKCGLTTSAREECPALESAHTALLTTPQQCGQPNLTKARADSWEEPGAFKEAAYEGPALTGCESLPFEPSLTAKPTTNLADSPSGLEVDLHQPQHTDLEEEGKPGRSSAPLKDLSLTLPEGLVINPSQADGLAACTPSQVGLTTKVSESPIHFDKQPVSCPDASKVGTVEVSSPLLAETEENGTKFRRDTEGEAIPRPLKGSVYVAQPFQNPFGSLIAIYLVVEDPQSGIVAKLASEVQPNPTTGQLTTTLTESPELPLEDAKVRLFPGPRAPLRTPPACATYTTHAQLTPWSAPQAKEAASSFQVTASPAGACPTTPQGAPNTPSFEAGTISPAAGAFSPFAMKLSRSDGTQPPSGFEATLAPGLLAKLAGVPYCSEQDITKARSREHPNEGALEQADPSCPATTQIGTLDVGAGSGPTPFHTTGKVYLAGPYKGAPLSAVVITPAVAGPFDLGAVVVRAGIYLDPESGVARTVSDPLPQILEGIPLDVRSIALSLNRPSFTLNPTNCDPLAITGNLTSVFGSVAPLSSRFQVGGCKSLTFGPKLSIRLSGKTNRGAHPALRAVLTAKPGEAGIARTQVALPHSEFIDQAHFRTICTRVQFAANQCPAGSVYGQIKASTPLTDYPLEGPIYLRSSSHKLPDVVAVLKGPAYQPIEVVLDGRVDSVNQGIRTTFEGVPDAPVTKAIVTLQGGAKGLFQNSTNICKEPFRATVKMTGQNAKQANSNPVLNATGCKKKPAKHKKGSGKKKGH